MPGQKKKSRAMSLLQREKRYWRRRKLTPEDLALARLREECRNPNGQEFVPDTESLDTSTSNDRTSDTHLPTDFEIGTVNVTDSDSVTRISTTSDSDDDEPARKRHCPGPEGPQPGEKRTYEQAQLGPSTSKRHQAGTIEKSWEVKVTQHPDERDGQTKFAIPININLGRTEDELQNVDNEINALTTAFGQDYEPDYTSGSGASIGSVAGASDHDQDTGAESFHGNESIAEMISHASSGPAEEVDYAVPIDLDFFDDPDLNYIAKDFVQEAQRLNMNRTQKVGMWEYTKRHHPELSIEMKSYDTLERRVRSVMPAPKVSWKVRDIATNELSSGAGWAFPEKEYGNRDKCEVQEVWTRLSLRDLIRFHAGLHRDSCPFVIDGKIDYNLVDVTFTVDGVPYAKSSSDNLHLMALRFKGCRLVYIAQARVAKKGFPKDVNTFLDPFVEECVTLNVNVNYFIADAPMRAFLKRLKGHAGRYSCEVCEARGSCLQRRICYPSDQVSQRLRSRPRWRECLLDLESQRKQGHVDHVKGIMGASPLLRLPNQFDIVRQCPTDPMHRDWLGLMKSTLWRNTVGISKAGNVSARGQRITQFVNDHYKHVQLPQEYSHRSRAIDYANYKAHEWQSLLVTSFHKIAEIVTTEVGERLAKIWTVFAFFTFLYYGPTWVQESMDESALEDLHEQLYKDFEEEFGELACSYNWHTYHHMPLVRKFGRPSQVSTEPFESAYGHAQTSFASGTRNIGLQICRNMLLRNLSHEPRRDQCSRKLIMNTPNESVRSDDSILIDDNLKFYKIVDLRRDSVTVVRMVTRHWESVLDPTLPFHQVGVCVYDSLDDEEIVRPKTYFQGKGVLLNDGLLVPLHKELLHS